MERTPPLTLGRIRELCTAGAARCNRILSLLDEVNDLLTGPLVPDLPDEILGLDTPPPKPALPAPRRRQRRARAEKTGGVTSVAVAPPAATPPPPPPTGGLSIDEAAARAGTSRAPIERAFKLGELLGTRLSPRKTRIDPDSLDAWIAARQSPAPATPPPPPPPPPPSPTPTRRVPLGAVLTAPPAAPHVTRPRYDGTAEPINPMRQTASEKPTPRHIAAGV